MSTTATPGPLLPSSHPPILPPPTPLFLYFSISLFLYFSISLFLYFSLHLFSIVSFEHWVSSFCLVQLWPHSMELLGAGLRNCGSVDARLESRRVSENRVVSPGESSPRVGLVGFCKRMGWAPSGNGWVAQPCDPRCPSRVFVFLRSRLLD